MIEVKNITKIYKMGDAETVALNNISFEYLKENLWLLLGLQDVANQL